MPYIEIINIYILIFTKIIERRYAKCPSQINKKTSCCNIVKYSSLLCFKAFLSPLSHCFDSAGVVPLQREKIAYNENLKVWTSIWAGLDIRVVSYRFAIFDWSLATLIFLWADGFCSAHGLPSPPLPSFPFSV